MSNNPGKARTESETARQGLIQTDNRSRAGSWQTRLDKPGKDQDTDETDYKQG